MYPNFFSKWRYYLGSIFTLLTEIANPLRTILIFIKPRPEHPFHIRLRKGLSFKVRSKMDVWVIKESCIDKLYNRSFVELGEDWQVIDIGAAFGDFSVLAATACPKGHVYSFEPLLVGKPASIPSVLEWG